MHPGRRWTALSQPRRSCPSAAAPATPVETWGKSGQSTEPRPQRDPTEVAHRKQGWRRSYSKTSCSTPEKAVRADEMALQVKVPVTEPEGLNWILRTHMVEGRANSWKLSSDLHICAPPADKTNLINWLIDWLMKAKWNVLDLELIKRKAGGQLWVSRVKPLLFISYLHKSCDEDFPLQEY